MSIDLIGAFVGVGLVSFLFGLFYAALIDARDKRWMAKHLRTRDSDAGQPLGAPASAHR